jgi:hypothetical protein
MKNSAKDEIGCSIDIVHCSHPATHTSFSSYNGAKANLDSDQNKTLDEVLMCVQKCISKSHFIAI